MEHSRNQGYPAAVNTGLKAVTGDIIIVSNNDIVFTPGWLEALLKPLTLGYDVSSICTSDQGWETRDEITEGDRFGSLWAIKRQVYGKIGGLDERFGRGTFEDADYWRRALAAGFRVAKNHAGLVEHLGRRTFDTIDPGHQTFEANKKIYLDKWGKLD